MLPTRNGDSSLTRRGSADAGKSSRGGVSSIGEFGSSVWERVKRRLPGNKKPSVSDVNMEMQWNTESKSDNSLPSRFSLLLLDPGEIYFEDFSVVYFPVSQPEDEALKRRQRGRLKMCSKSILFDPLDTAFPILKFPQKDCSAISKWTGPLLSKLDTQGDVLAIDCKLEIRMKEGNIIAPYVFIRGKKQHLFSFNFVPLNSVIPQLQQLNRATTLPPSEQIAMINTIVHSRQAKISFNTSWLEDPLHEKILYEATADRITPLVCNPGQVLLSSSRLYFQPFNKAYTTHQCKLSSIKRMVKRRYLLRHVGIEIFSAEGSHMYLVFDSSELRDKFHDKILLQPDIELQDTRQENMTLRWQTGAISNFDYLMYLNSMADRSFNDLTQYPVFPWVVSDFTSTQLDLTNPKTFRDLSKPIGALNQTRLEHFKQRYKEMPEPKFLYGSHYSTPGYVLYYLVRVAPEYMLCLQGGKFDQADRLFTSIQETWENVLSGHADVKELIPEFYQSNGEFLQNLLHLPLGFKQDKSKVQDVKLPPWAKDAQDFIRKHREALECPYVSQNLHKWLDLIFGCKQRGEEALKADNVFFYLTYEGAVDLDKLTDLNERAANEAQILEFGQTPKQLFKSPHPQRQVPGVNIPHSISLPIIKDVVPNPKDEDVPIITVDVDVEECMNGFSLWSGIDKLKKTQNHKLHKEEKKEHEVKPRNLKVNHLILARHRSAVTSVKLSHDTRNIFSVSQDTQLKMYSLEDTVQIRSINLSSMALSSCAIMPDGKTIVVGSWDNNIYIYSVEYARVVDSKQGHDDAISSLSWNDGILVTASWDSTVKVWRFVPDNEGRKPAPLEILAELEHDTEVNSVDLDPTNTLVATGTMDGGVLVWNIDHQCIVSTHPIHTEAVNSVLFSPDGQRVLSCGADGYVRMLDVNTGMELYSKDIGDEIKCAAWDGQMVIVGLLSGELQVWDLVQSERLATIKGHKGPVRCIDVSSDGSAVVTGGEDNQVILWRLAV